MFLHLPFTLYLVTVDKNKEKPAGGIPNSSEDMLAKRSNGVILTTSTKEGLVLTNESKVQKASNSRNDPLVAVDGST